MEIETYKPDEWDADAHFYPRALNAQIHPLVLDFCNMSLERLMSRYCHLHPKVSPDKLQTVLTTPPRYFHWSGSDLFNVANEDGVRQKLIVETNSCPSGQKSFPSLEENKEEGGYWRLMNETFLPLMSKAIKKGPPDGILAVIYDKNHMESSGYAQVFATISRRPVYLIPSTMQDPDKYLEVKERKLFAKIDGKSVPIVCAFRYVTQRPWNRLLLSLKTPVLNPVIACLAGGRNKAIAAKAYEIFNAEQRNAGLEILIPETFTNVRKAEIPLILSRLGGRGVIKVPYLNAGQGIYTIVNDRELQSFMEEEHPYNSFVVQQLVGNVRWSSRGQLGRVYNIGTIPGPKKKRIYFFDLRMMISWQHDNYRPVAMYARRARQPMAADLEAGESSWEVLGTNLSKKVGDGKWETEPKRLLMFDRRDFTKLGLGMDDLIDSFMQTVFANRAIDNLAQKLVKRGGTLNRDLFRSLNDDPTLFAEIKLG